jgi:hypothetical protein
MAEDTPPPASLVNVNVTLTDSQFAKLTFPPNTSSISYDALESTLQSEPAIAPSSEKVHELDSAGLLAFAVLLLLSVVTIWGFKYRRSRYIHESGLCIIYGAVIGLIVRYEFHARTASSIRCLNVSKPGLALCRLVDAPLEQLVSVCHIYCAFLARAFDPKHIHL